MSEQLDYVNSCIEKAREVKLERMLNGTHKTVEDLRYDVGYLKALQDVDSFQRDYIEAKNPQKPEDE